MDRAWQNLLVRTFGSFALAALLVHAGLDAPARPLPGLYLVPFFLAALVANWALARLNVKRPALWTTTVLLGAIPLAMPLLHAGDLGASALYDGVLYAGAASGLATLALGALMLRERGAGAATPDE